MNGTRLVRGTKTADWSPPYHAGAHLTTAGPIIGAVKHNNGREARSTYGRPRPLDRRQRNDGAGDAAFQWGVHQVLTRLRPRVGERGTPGTDARTSWTRHQSTARSPHPLRHPGSSRAPSGHHHTGATTSGPTRAGSTRRMAGTRQTRRLGRDQLWSDASASSATSTRLRFLPTYGSLTCMPPHFAGRQHVALGSAVAFSPGCLAEARGFPTNSCCAAGYRSPPQRSALHLHR